MNDLTLRNETLNRCGASAPLDGIVHICVLRIIHAGDHDSGSATWESLPESFAPFYDEEREVYRGPLPEPGLATEDVLVAPPNARNVTPDETPLRTPRGRLFARYRVTSETALLDAIRREYAEETGSRFTRREASVLLDRMLDSMNSGEPCSHGVLSDCPHFS
jgi:hypothetical protein